MWDLATIRAMNREQGRKSKKVKPYHLLHKEEIDTYPPFPFPSVGDRSDDFDESYDRIDSLFVDSTGFGGPHEPALTSNQLKYRLQKLYDEHGPLLLAIESVGQFQVNIGVWKTKKEPE
jgi:hypothetical protein